MIKKILLLVMIPLIVNADGGSSCMESDMQFGSSRNAHALVIYDEKCGQILVYSESNKVFSIYPKDTEQVHDVPLQLIASISPSGKYLLVGFNAGESVRVFQIFSLADKDLIYERIGTNAEWRGGVDTLLVVPNYSLDETQETPGLIEFQLDKKIENRIFSEFLFTGELRIAENILAARIVQDPENNPTYAIIMGNLSTGKAKIVSAGK